jgi:Tfp pilus assembly protein PilZ
MSTEKRRHERLAFQGTIFIELLARGMGGHEGEVLVCKTIDISHAGLRVEVKRRLTVGAILQIGVDLSSAQDTLYLAGEVIWCQKDETLADNWLVGFELMNANDSDIEAWRRALTEMGSTESSSSNNNDQ